jgi:hypothetical protein
MPLSRRFMLQIQSYPGTALPVTAFPDSRLQYQPLCTIYASRADCTKKKAHKSGWLFVPRNNFVSAQINFIQASERGILKQGHKISQSQGHPISRAAMGNQ